MPTTVALDDSAYDILDVVKIYLRERKGRSGASFSDAVRELHDQIPKSGFHNILDEIRVERQKQTKLEVD